MRLIAVVLTVMTVGGIAVSGVAVAQETPGSDEDVDTQQSSYLRVIHAASDAPAVDVAVDNETVATGVEAGNASDYLQLESGNHTIQVTASSDDANATDNESGETLFEGQIYLEQRTSSTLALTADQNQTMTGGAAETPTDDNETDMGTNETDTESAFGANETEDNETTFGENETDTESAFGENETDNETTLGENDTEDNETTLGENDTEMGANETENNETTLGDNETETESAFGENETEGGAAEAPTEDTQAPSLTPVMYVDNAWQPSDDQAALSVIHLASGADAVDVTIADNESDDGTTSADENTTAGNETDTDQSSNATVIAEDLEFQDASDYMTVPAGEHTLEIRQASETNDGQIITTVNVSVEGGNAYSALAMSGDNATNQTTTGGAAETPTDDNETDTETEFGANETEDNETTLGENTTDNETTLGENETDNETTLGENDTEDNETTLGENDTEMGANETDDNETMLGENDTEMGANETDDNETTLGEDTTDTETETEDDETALGDTDTQSQVSLNVTTVQDVTYSINLPNQNATDNGTVDAGDEEDDETTSIALAG